VNLPAGVDRYQTRLSIDLDIDVTKGNDKERGLAAGRESDMDEGMILDDG
jgi:hypothetical protein